MPAAKQSGADDLHGLDVKNRKSLRGELLDLRIVEAQGDDLSFGPRRQRDGLVAGLTGSGSPAVWSVAVTPIGVTGVRTATGSVTGTAAVTTVTTVTTVTIIPIVRPSGGDGSIEKMRILPARLGA